jgi:hypothetical protein
VIAKFRFYTLAEANAQVAGLEQAFRTIDAHLAEGRPIGEQVADLETVWGDRIKDPGCPGHGEWTSFKAALHVHDAAIRTAVSEVHAQGIEIKDIATGLCDFYAKRGEETVYLCWKKGEEEVAFWHTLEGGFAGRKPMKDF